VSVLSGEILYPNGQGHLKWRRIFDPVDGFQVQAEEVKHRGPDEQDDADDLGQLVQASLVAALGLDKGEDQVIDQGAPDLDQHRVFAGPPKAFDLEVFLIHLKKFSICHRAL